VFFFFFFFKNSNGFYFKARRFTEFAITQIAKRPINDRKMRKEASAPFLVAFNGILQTSP